uniref:BTB_2 domain-containing protein n=1 Tax=Rhabditophanes sp. KR3021 TaxID=114890 RepID=A0AC35TZN5_9BILA
MDDDMPVHVNIGGVFFTISPETIRKIPLIAHKYFPRRNYQNERRFSAANIRKKFSETINAFKNSNGSTDCPSLSSGKNSPTISLTPATHTDVIEKSQKSASPSTHVFIDRDSKYFPIILAFARNDEEPFEASFNIDSDDELIALEKECKFYQVTDLQQICQLLLEPFKPNHTVTWRQSAIDFYWRSYVHCIVDSTLTLPFLFEKNSHLLAKCIACEDVQEPKMTSIIDVNAEGWLPLAHHMRSMKGIIISTIHDTCCIVEWQNGSQTHLPRSSLKRVLEPVLFSSGSTTPDHDTDAE